MNGTARLDQGMAHRLGLIVLSTDETLEVEARQVLAGRDDIGLYHSRILSADEVTPDSLLAMGGRIAASASLLPEGVGAVGYGCTSASIFIGPDAVAGYVHQVRPGVAVTNPLSAVLAGLQALGVRKIGMVTPYTAQVAAPMREVLAGHGIEVLHEVSFGEADDRRVARIAQEATAEAVRAAAVEGAEAVFASCTNLRTFGVIEALEAELGVPVVSSNQALIWDLLRQAGIDAKGRGPGRLFGDEGD